MKNDRLKGMSADAMLLTVIKLVTIVLGLVTTRLLSQYLSVHDYGTYTQILLIVSTVSSLTIFGMLDGTKFFYCAECDAKKRESYVATIFSLQFLIGTVVGAVVMLLTVPLCGYFDNQDIKGLLIFAAVLPVFQNLIGILQVLIVSIGKARKLALKNLIVSLVRLATVICMVALFGNITVIMVATLLLDIFQIAYFGVILRKSGCNIRISKTNFRLLGNILRYCAPMAVFVVVSSINRDLDKYLVSAMTNTETLAMYSNASKQLPFDLILSSFGTILAPQITRLLAAEDRKNAANLFKVFMEVAYISTGILCCAALAAAPQLMELLYSDKYIDGIVIFIIYIFVDLMRFTNTTIVMAAAGRTGLLMVLGLGTMLGNAVLNVVLYHVMGIMGPAVATLIVTTAVGILMLYIDCRILHTRMGSLFDGRYLIRFVCLSIVMTTALLALRNHLRNMGVHYFAILIIVVAIYGVSMLLLNGKRLLKDLKGLNAVSES